jgi:uncharacterized LabA/DUF88 family protein
MYTYLFIDGAQLQTIYRDVFVPVFGDSYEIDYSRVKESFNARRAYLYDCLDDVQKQGENSTDFQTRVERQEAKFDAISKVDGLLVRLGHLSSGKKRQQKEVDVLLAVDMLTHAANKNTDEAVLLSGDRDFRPVVESVVRLGTRVKIAYDPRIGSKELAREADSVFEINITNLCDWTKVEKYTVVAPFPGAWPRNGENAPPFSGSTKEDREGVIGPKSLLLRLGKIPDTPVPWVASVQMNRKDYMCYTHHNRDELLAYLEKRYGHIVW